MNTALNRTSVALLTNKSGGSVAQGDVVVVDSANANAFTTTTTSGYVNGMAGVVLEPNGIASNATGAVALGGYVPLVNLSSSASLGDVFKTHSVAKQALRHAGPIVAGDFGQVLGTGTTPAALLGELPAQAGGGTTPPAELGYVQTTTAQSGIGTTFTDLTSLTLTVTVGARAIVLEGYLSLPNTTNTGNRILLLIMDTTGGGTTTLTAVGVAAPTAGIGYGSSVKVRVAPAAGSRSYKVQAAVDAGTMTTAASATTPVWFQIREV